MSSREDGRDRPDNRADRIELPSAFEVRKDGSTRIAGSVRWDLLQLKKAAFG
jgi:hypothetical protein